MTVVLGDNWLTLAVMGALLSSLAIAVCVLGLLVTRLDKRLRRHEADHDVRRRAWTARGRARRQAHRGPLLDELPRKEGARAHGPV